MEEFNRHNFPNRNAAKPLREVIGVYLEASAGSHCRAIAPRLVSTSPTERSGNTYGRGNSVAAWSILRVGQPAEFFHDALVGDRREDGAFLCRIQGKGQCTVVRGTERTCTMFGNDIGSTAHTCQIFAKFSIR